MAKPQALVAKKIEWLPIDNPQNKMYTDKLLSMLDRRVKRDPMLYVLYRNGRMVRIGQSDQGMSKLKSIAMDNKKKKTWDKFAIYTISKRAYLNDVEALANRIAMDQRLGWRNFARARNTTEDIKADIRKWASTEIRGIERTLRPLDRKYRKSMQRFDTKEKKLRKGFGKRIDKAKDAARQKALRMDRDKRIMKLRMERKKLAPWRQSIVSWQAKIRSFQATKL